MPILIVGAVDTIPVVRVLTILVIPVVGAGQEATPERASAQVKETVTLWVAQVPPV